MKDKIVFTFAELDYIYGVVKNAVDRYEEPIIKQNEHYLKMVELKEKLEKIELVLNIEE